MSLLKWFIPVTGVMVFGLLTACGEFEKAVHESSEANVPEIKKSIDGLDEGLTSEEDDREAIEIVNEFHQVTSGTYSRQLGSDIEAFSIVRNDTFDDDGLRSMRMAATVLLGCESDQKLSFSKVVDIDKLLNQQVVSLGNDKNYEVLVICTQDGSLPCSEMVARVLKVEEDGYYGKASYGMIGYQTSGSYNSRKVEYTSRITAEERGLLVASSVPYYSGICQLAADEQAAQEDGLDDLFAGEVEAEKSPYNYNHPGMFSELNQGSVSSFEVKSPDNFQYNFQDSQQDENGQEDDSEQQAPWARDFPTYFFR